MREPSIHITISVFNQIAEEMGIELDSKTFFRRARNYSVPSRSVLKGNNRKNRRKLTQIQQASIADTNLLADVIYAVRVKLHHTGVTKIGPSNSQWRYLKELVEKVNQYCQAFNMQKRAGYIDFVTRGMKLFAETKRRSMQSPVTYLNASFEKIFDMAKGEWELNHDSNPEGTSEIYNIYINKILDMTGIPNNYKNDPEQYIYFKYAREQADSVGADYETYIEAQFDALSFCNGIPKIEDLAGEKAQERLVRYLSRNNITLQSHQRHTSVDWSKFKQ